MTASTASPISSPRLPSPPPIAEDQLGPKSPSPASHEQQKLSSTLDGASRRIRPGTKAEDMAEGPPLVDLSEIESAFQYTEHLKALHNFLTHPIGSNSTIAVDRDMAHKLAQPPEGVDKTLWLYELCRFLTQKVNSIIIALFSDNPACSSITCPEMRASEWQYLCAVHDPPKSCCAIDYCCHTLDWAANTLTSPKNFPSRLAMSTDSLSAHAQVKNLTNIFRRVYRIFAHAWFQHQEMFWKVEGRTGLYILFKTVCDMYGLIQEDNYTIPPEAEGVEPSEGTGALPPPLILKRGPSVPAPSDDNTSIIEAGENTLSTAGTTKRHRHSPTVSATPVSTVVEENEEEEEPVAATPTSTSQEEKEAEAEAGAPTEPPKPAEDVDEEPESTESRDPIATEDAEEHASTSASEAEETNKDGSATEPTEETRPSTAVKSIESVAASEEKSDTDKEEEPVAEASEVEATSDQIEAPETSEKADVEAATAVGLDKDKDKDKDKATIESASE
ncbi:Mob1/phocein [Byssothecium circinans]|uniref:Mob1/phocein n=1 Tax=Byssothecium circinans TaxID=147558 RepID=A0A6A5U8L4_9PLEO|nr:Mob1/phocein [Byssothecium circinans]